MKDRVLLKVEIIEESVAGIRIYDSRHCDKPNDQESVPENAIPENSQGASKKEKAK